jgi:hypothetical protein
MPKKGDKDRKTLVCEGNMGQSSHEKHEHQNWSKKALSKGYVVSSGRPTPTVCLPIECSRWQLTFIQYPNNPRPTTVTMTTSTASATQADDEKMGK